MSWDDLNAFWEWIATTWASVLPPGAIDFPDSPTEGDEFGRFVWNSSKGTWDFIEA